MKAICCWFIISICFCAIVPIQAQVAPCTTPNDKKASCVLLFDCPILLKASARKDPITRIFLLASACGDDKFSVCCGTSRTFTKIPTNLPPSVLSNLPTNLPSLGLPNLPTTIPQLGVNLEGINKKTDFNTLSKDSRRTFVTENLLATKTHCGLQHTDDYFYNSTETSVDEFPWMALIPTKVFRKGDLPGNEFTVGTLISPRYVLTDQKVPWGIVILGLHHVYKEVSCIGTPFGTDDCTTNTLTEIIEGFLNGSTLQLLRLARNIVYSDFVRPICLPLEDSEKPQPGDTLLTSGWGEEEITESKDVKIKKRIQHTLIVDRECELRNPISNPICAVTFQNSTRYACPGDNGGPLMYRLQKDARNWIALGIIIRTSSCIKYQPVVAQKITSKVLNWILDTIHP